MEKTYKLKVNSQTYEVTAESNTPLLWVLRDFIGLVGTKYGCGIGECGACTVHINGKATRSCLKMIAEVEGQEVTTIEGLSENNTHPVQQAWKALDVPQCGYCQAGQIMTAASFLNENTSPSVQEIREAMHGNICRCAAYNRIEKAVALAANNTKK